MLNREKPTRRSSLRQETRSLSFDRPEGRICNLNDANLSRQSNGFLQSIFHSKTGLLASRFYTVKDLSAWSRKSIPTIRRRLTELLLFGYAEIGICGGRWVYRFSNTRSFLPVTDRAKPVFCVPKQLSKRKLNSDQKRPRTVIKNPALYIREQDKKQEERNEKRTPSGSPSNIVLLFPPGRANQMNETETLFDLPEPSLTEIEARELEEAIKPPKKKRKAPPITPHRKLYLALLDLCRENGIAVPMVRKDQILSIRRCKNILGYAEKKNCPLEGVIKLFGWSFTQNDHRHYFTWNLLERAWERAVNDYQERVINPKRAEIQAVEDDKRRTEAYEKEVARLKAIRARKASNADRPE